MIDKNINYNKYFLRLIKDFDESTMLSSDLNGTKKEKTITGFPSTVLSHEYDHLNGVLHMDKGLEVLLMNKEERKEFRKKYGYEVYEQEGKFEELVKCYDYDSSTKKLIKNKKDN